MSAIKFVKSEAGQTDGKPFLLAEFSVDMKQLFAEVHPMPKLPDAWYAQEKGDTNGE